MTEDHDNAKGKNAESHLSVQPDGWSNRFKTIEKKENCIDKSSKNTSNNDKYGKLITGTKTNITKSINKNKIEKKKKDTALLPSPTPLLHPQPCFRTRRKNTKIHPLPPFPPPTLHPLPPFFSLKLPAQFVRW